MTDERLTEVVTRFLALEDLTAAAADALEANGLPAPVVPAHVLAPLAHGMRVCGPARTLRYEREDEPAESLRAAGTAPRMGHAELRAACRPGDVVVIDCGGTHDLAVIGGRSGSALHAAGVAGVLVDGSVRDLDELGGTGIPVWSRGRTPRSALHRLRSVATDVPVSLAGVPVAPGDLVLADGSGTVVVPRDRAGEVLATAEALVAHENSGGGRY
ncbi:RraA family protein [Ornithinicoccus hortensis]|uniref:Putative 4-hydroxy-4-methyl-2-oxoglutarate aldolase n=1 Tax=Ornithinicoccus hortensis TaxID=82346 RepID=A0A542YQF3_9MICO|nr:RraA family protein [Ornithinicoccus hortensis]TQL50338.1 regulator of RNase E activity RraA [Ornithinicoccus hortensis]